VGAAGIISESESVSSGSLRVSDVSHAVTYSMSLSPASSSASLASGLKVFIFFLCIRVLRLGSPNNERGNMSLRVTRCSTLLAFLFAQLFEWFSNARYTSENDLLQPSQQTCDFVDMSFSYEVSFCNLLTVGLNRSFLGGS